MSEKAYFSLVVIFYFLADLSIGVYELLPYYKGENTIFDVSPPSMSISIEHHHVTIPQKFQVWLVLGVGEIYLQTFG